MLTRRELILRVAARSVTVILPLLMGLVAARALGPSGRGLVALGVGLALGVSALAGLGRGHMVRQAMRLEGFTPPMRSVLARYTRQVLLVSFPLSLVAGAVAYGVTSSQDFLSRSFVLATSVFCLVAPIHSLLTSSLIGGGAHWAALVGDILPWLLAFPVFSATVLGGFASGATYMVSLALGYLTSLLLLGLRLRTVFERRAAKPAPAPRVNPIEQATSGRPWAYDLLDFGTARSDRLYSALIMPAGDAGIYAVAGTFTAVWRFIPISIGLLGTSLQPARLPKPLASALSHPVGIGMAVMGVLLGGTAIVGPGAAVWLLGSDYSAVALPMRLLCTAEFALAVYTMLSLAQVGSATPYRGWLPPLVGAALLPPSMVLGYQAGGVGGAAAGTAVTFLVVAIAAVRMQQLARR